MTAKKQKSYNDYELCKDIAQSELTTAQIAEKYSGRIQGNREMSGTGWCWNNGRGGTERGPAHIHDESREMTRKRGGLGNSISA